MIVEYEEFLPEFHDIPTFMKEITRSPLIGNIIETTIGRKFKITRVFKGGQHSHVQVTSVVTGYKTITRGDTHSIYDPWYPSKYGHCVGSKRVSDMNLFEFKVYSRYRNITNQIKVKHNIKLEPKYQIFSNFWKDLDLIDGWDGTLKMRLINKLTAKDMRHRLHSDDPYLHLSDFMYR